MPREMPDPPNVEEVLRASEARLHEAQAVGRMGDWELDRDSGAMSWSPQLFRLFERPSSQGIPDLNEALGYYSLESVELTRAAFWEAIDTGARLELEQTVHLPSGAERFHATTIVPVKNHRGRVYKLYGTTQDITERKLAEQELRRKTFEIEDLYQNAPCGYYSLDADGMIIRINETLLRWLGHDRDEIVGRMRAFELFSPASRALFGQVFRTFKKTGLLRNMDIELLRRDGSSLPVLLSSTAIFDAQGNFVASRTVLSDNSDRKQLELERAAHAARLAELSRHMVDVQENERRKFAAELHDHTSPNLAALQLTLTNLARALPAPVLAELEPLLDDAQALLLDTITGIRDVCTNLRPATLDYAGLIPAVQDYAQQFRQRTGIAVHLDTTHFTMQLPSNVQSLLFRITQEALTNCAKHARATNIRIQLENSDSLLCMEVADDGVGFDPHHLGESGTAPGLGLITMKERAEFAGGAFELKSAPDAGTAIRVSFDLQAGEFRRQPRPARNQVVEHSISAGRV
ncbi:PAS domain-containing sensor histidine kinase [Aromatoleum petrolei]|uniref:PAS domain-containing protein n=2 Tax=Aromatoleum petrolei TaxID=76116 RepID=A0ABX1MUN5_9RHOO|nr:PAS domain-containing protein [Aromatoleum petrolei]NMF89789.1 PAS domain-containing protein [Aromatoleum petrolei]QTQ35050.1 Two component system sensor histidine kinase [Aromatoleum petrolei]